MEKRFFVGEKEGYIVKDGQSYYNILLRKNATSAEKYAAEEFNRLTKEACGAELLIVEKKGNLPVISIGETELKKNLVISAGRAELNRNGFRIKNFGKNIIIAAPNFSGLLYAVYRFMELTANYMYYAPDEWVIGDSIPFSEVDIVDYPDFPNRDVYNYDTKEFPNNATRLYLTGSNFSVWEEKYGEGSWWSSLHDQSIVFQIVDYKKYRAEHKNWYCGGDGSITQKNPQICYTTALYDRDKFSKGDWNEQNYSDGRHGLFWTFVYNLINNYIAVEKDKSLFQLGMSDNSTYCDCEQCKADVAKYSRSGVAIRFANAVADEVEKWRVENCPEREIYLTMFAYITIVDPPTKVVNGKHVPIDESVIARDNIVIRYAPISDNYMYPLMDEKNNPKSRNAILGWSAVASKLAVWDYRVDFGAMFVPFPQWLSAYANIKTYWDYGFIDLFQQACRTSGGTPFIAMDNWVRSRLLWNVNQDYNKLTDQFIDAYYMLGGNCIREYRAFLTRHYYFLEEKFGYKGNSHFCVCKTKYFSYKCIRKIERIFKKGYKFIQLNETDKTRKEKAVKRLNDESMFYRFMLLVGYSHKFSLKKRRQMFENFEEIAKEAGTKVMFDTFDSMEFALRVIRLPFTDK